MMKLERSRKQSLPCELSSHDLHWQVEPTIGSLLMRADCTCASQSLRTVCVCVADFPTKTHTLTDAIVAIYFSCRKFLQNTEYIGKRRSQMVSLS